MHRFEEEDQEPVAVVRTLSDFALALTLVVLMLIGTRTVAGNRPVAETRAATAQAGRGVPELTLLMNSDRTFNLLDGQNARGPLSAAGLAQPWMASHPSRPATIVVEFPAKTLASDLHRALLDLQTAFGTNLAHIDTIPKL